jgi:hypothetical protein
LKEWGIRMGNGGGRDYFQCAHVVFFHPISSPLPVPGKEKGHIPSLKERNQEI